MLRSSDRTFMLNIFDRCTKKFHLDHLTMEKMDLVGNITLKAFTKFNIKYTICTFHIAYIINSCFVLIMH